MDAYRQRSYKTEAIIIKRVKLGEADRILTFYTPFLGKMQAVAKGVRKTTSKLAGHLEPFTQSELGLARGRNLDVITAAHALETFPEVRGSLTRTTRALYLLELVDRFTPDHMENPALYRLLLDGLHWLESGSAGDTTLRWFETRLLSNAGYRPELRHCVICQEPLPAAPAFFSPPAGGAVCGDCRAGHGYLRPVSLKALKVLRFLESAGREEVGRLRVDEPLRNELSALLNSYIEYHLEGELRTRPFLLERVDLAPAPALP